MSVGSVFRALWPPVVFGAVFLGLWQFVVEFFDIAPYLLPSPSAIWTALVDNWDQVLDAMYVTGANAFVGLVIGIVLGVALSFVMMRFHVANELVTPLAVALNAIPIIVLVPVFNNMLASTTEVPRRLMVTLIVSFIVLVNVAKGLRQVSPLHVELMRSYAASPRQILVKTRIPNAVPFLFTAVKIAAPVAVITAFVAEYFGGSQNGLGYGITSNASTSRTAAMWAYVVGACALGLVFYLVAVGLERLASPASRAARLSSGRRARPGSTQQPSRGFAPGGASAT
jgi:NitT/TauT family transport system permease protein